MKGCQGFNPDLDFRAALLCCQKPLPVSSATRAICVALKIVQHTMNNIGFDNGQGAIPVFGIDRGVRVNIVFTA